MCEEKLPKMHACDDCAWVLRAIHDLQRSTNVGEYRLQRVRYEDGQDNDTDNKLETAG